MFEVKEFSPRCVRGRILCQRTLSNYDIVDAVTGARVASVDGMELKCDSSGALAWIGNGGAVFVSGDRTGGDGCRLDFGDTGSDFPEFHFGILVVNLGGGRYRVLRFDGDTAADAELNYKVSAGDVAGSTILTRGREPSDSKNTSGKTLHRPERDHQ